jgi:hypothetical protein
MLPLHILNALNGSIKLINSEATQAPTKTATQKKIESLKGEFSPRVIALSINAIDDNDYEFSAHEFSEGEALTIDTLN